MEPKELRIPFDIENMCEAEDAAWVLNYEQISKCEEFVRQLIRNWFSRFTEGHDESCPVEVEICPDQNGHDGACGLSSLEMPWIVGIFQIPGEGMIWFMWEGGRVQDLDDMPTWEQMEIMRDLEQFYGRDAK